MNVSTSGEGEFDAICLDIDNGPGWLVHEANAEVYTDATLALIGRRLRAGGRLAVWAAAPDDEFEALLRCENDFNRGVVAKACISKIAQVFAAKGMQRPRGKHVVVSTRHSSAFSNREPARLLGSVLVN